MQMVTGWKARQWRQQGVQAPDKQGIRFEKLLERRRVMPVELACTSKKAASAVVCVYSLQSRHGSAAVYASWRVYPGELKHTGS